jgi:hypothetical protein
MEAWDVEHLNSLLAQIETARLWNYFHKDWLLQIRLAVRQQLPADYRVFVESEVVLITPETFESPVESILPDVSVTRGGGSQSGAPQTEATSASAAVFEAEEPCEAETHYSLVVRRAPENYLVAAAELVSPSNQGVGNRLDQQRFLRKRSDYFDGGINLLEIDTLIHGERILPERLSTLRSFERVAWSAFHEGGWRRFRGHGWNSADPLPQIAWRIDAAQVARIDLGATLAEAADFNQWTALVNRAT